AWTAGLACALALLAVYARDLSSASSLVLRSTLVAAVVAAAVLVFTSDVSEIEARLQSVFLDRGERSAHTRFGIWDRGMRILQEEVPVGGIGPGRFRELEGDEMHNDLLSFAVERGVLGLLGLCVIGALVVGRAMRTFRADPSPDGHWRVVFPAAVVALLAESQTHEVFHVREAWLVLALQEAVLLGALGPAAPAGPPQPSSTAR
ncbi:MAG TPA: O-antigen ligase family protein, partial [Planctomycetota bacterium]|nr:O-antigen ligase family protein [Planctomycetota bacterium]